MCSDCLDIHVEDHQSSATPAQVLPFSEVSAEFDSHLRSSLSRLKKLSERACQFSIQERLKQCLTDISKARTIFVQKVQEFFDDIESQAREISKSAALQFDIKSLSQQTSKLEDIIKRNERCESLRQLILYYSNDPSMQFDSLIEQSQSKINELSSYDPFYIEIKPDRLQQSLSEFIRFANEQHNQFNRFSSQKSHNFKSSKDYTRPSPKNLAVLAEDHPFAVRTFPQQTLDSHQIQRNKYPMGYDEEHRVNYQTHKGEAQIHQTYRVVQGAHQPSTFLLNQGQQNFQLVNNHVNHASYQRPEHLARHTYRVIHPQQQQLVHTPLQFQRSNSHNSIRRPAATPIAAPLETHFRGVTSSQDTKQIVYLHQGQQLPLFQHTPSKDIIIMPNQHEPHRFQLSPTVTNLIKPLQRPSPPLPPFQAQYPPKISTYLPMQNNTIVKQFVHQTQPMVLPSSAVHNSQNSQQFVETRSYPFISPAQAYNQNRHHPQKPFFPVVVQSDSQNSNENMHQNIPQSVHQKLHTQQQFTHRASTPLYNQSRQTVPLTQRSFSQIKVQQQKFDTFAKAKLEIQEPKDREKLQTIINNLKNQSKETYSKNQSRRSSLERREENRILSRQEEQLRVDYLPVKQPSSSRRDYKFMFHKEGLGSDLQLYHLQERIENIRKQNDLLRRADS